MSLGDEMIEDTLTSYHGRRTHTFIYDSKHTIITYETRALALDEVLGHFADYLRGVGFVIDGQLVVEEDPDPDQLPEPTPEEIPDEP